MGLRLTEGVDLANLSARFGIAPDALVNGRKLALYRANGLLWQQGDHLGVTEAGMPLLDALLGEVVADDLVSA